LRRWIVSRDEITVLPTVVSTVTAALRRAVEAAFACCADVAVVAITVDWPGR
jgi:hypothetical protein